MVSHAEPTTKAQTASVGRKSLMDQLISGFVDRLLVPLIDAFVPMITNGVMFVIFALIWAAFAYGLIASQGSLDAAWQWLRAVPFIPQAILWLLFLPVTVALWIWESGWPLLVRLVLVIGLGGWNLWMFLPKALTAVRP
jgi:hypothetical protein